MKKDIVYLLLSIVLLSCNSADDSKEFTDNQPPIGDPITSITMQIQSPVQSRIGVDIDPDRKKDVYFWTVEDVLVLCELDEAGTAFTGNNYSYAIKEVPSPGQPASFEGAKAITTGNYIVLHTRNWANVSLPTAGGNITFNMPELTQWKAITTVNLDAVQAFADNLFFSTTKVTGEDLLAGKAILNHQLIQVEVEVNGEAVDNGKRIRRVELVPEADNSYAQSMTIDVAGVVTLVAGGKPATYVADPTAKLGTDYKVRMLTRPMNLAANNAVKVIVHSGLEDSAPSLATSAMAFNLGNVYTLTKPVGALKSISITAMDTAYIGAFWKKDQIGERLIRIQTKDARKAGKWTATLAWADANWAKEDIFLVEGNEPSNYNELYDPKVTDTYEVSYPSVVAKGTSTLSTGSVGPIFFRIGLRSKYTPTPDAPARYAVILLSYNNNTKNHLIYLRQGEDPATIGEGTDVKWSVYNVGNYKEPAQYENSGFVKYPSQAGYFKKWTKSTVMYSPVVTATGWASDKTYSPLGNVCPAGYSTPTFTAASTGEMASLFVGTNAGSKEHFLGYYADGYFDRQSIAIAQGTNPTFQSSVAPRTTVVGYQGYLVVNTSTYASLFFPCAGYLNATGALFWAGAYGRYWSSSADVTTSGGYKSYNLTLDKTSAKLENNILSSASDSPGYSIRCIKTKTP